MLAVIGGTGIYSLDGLEVLDEQTIETPFGPHSGPITTGLFNQQKLLFLPRHGSGHELLPHEINYRANIWALKSLGATRMIGLSAVGSLQEEIAPGELSLVSQYFDFVKGHREKSFFGQGLVAHVSTALPSCDHQAKQLINAANSADISLHQEKTYACVDGPRLGSRAESLFLKNAAQCDVVGMTNVPEAFLAREAQLCYTTIAIATDYDCWKEDPSAHATVEQIIARYDRSLALSKALLGQYLKQQEETPHDNTQCNCRNALKSAVLSSENNLSQEQKALLEVLQN
ncbi:MTAP family purine nucleoside phosphorylase [Endozoicomonas numazuensis]|uniref:Purine nucleoside phosphorylase n=1 Tax=Endozoicomonas numazuensis TaxID=1137799 RepID=A0A081NK74_9GAMM|nr:MTAP family purine nucleoside phosphorylase [Endozoicomonas numazuensis]KEQ18847.1 5'-methylthioadenosine phosphorylase [Endozoicomonas numazuensis]